MPEDGTGAVTEPEIEVLSEVQILKDRGNEAFKAKDYANAISAYTLALKDPQCVSAERCTLLVNRAMAHLRAAEAKDIDAQTKAKALELALDDAREARTAEPSRAKAHFREAQACLQLERKEAAKLALHRMWNVDPGNKEAHKLLLQCDEDFAKFAEQFASMIESTAVKRENLSMMVSRSHPRSLRTSYYKVWMVHWSPEDREVALSQAFLKVIDDLKQILKKGARDLAVGAKEKGEVDFGEDGFGVFRYMNKRNQDIENECFDLTGIVLADLMSERSYNEPALYCATVERVAESREDEHLTPAMTEEIAALRPKYLMGPQCAEHPLKAWMVREMGLQMRKQILIGLCLQTCLSAAGVVTLQMHATHDLRNMRRKAKGLPEVAPGEQSEDDEIMCKNDYEEYMESQPVNAKEAMQKMRGGGPPPGAAMPEGPPADPSPTPSAAGPTTATTTPSPEQGVTV